MPSKKKIQFVASLVDQLRHASHFVLVNFQSASHQTLENLRAKLRQSTMQSVDAPFQVVKNSLLKVAIEQLGKKELMENRALTGPSALMILPEDWSKALTAFYSMAKTDKNFKFKAGIIDGKIYFENELNKLASLPSREQLVAKIITSMKSPQTRLVYSMKFNMMKMIYVLKSASKKAN